MSASNPVPPVGPPSVIIEVHYEDDVAGAAEVLLALLRRVRPQDANTLPDTEHARRWPVAASEASGE